jgi:hypothetical protein
VAVEEAGQEARTGRTSHWLLAIGAGWLSAFEKPALCLQCESIGRKHWHAARKQWTGKAPAFVAIRLAMVWHAPRMCDMPSVVARAHWRRPLANLTNLTPTTYSGIMEPTVCRAWRN